MYEAFSRLKSGINLLALYGTLHQQRRMTIYDSFCRKQNAVLFATDIAARGLGMLVVYIHIIFLLLLQFFIEFYSMDDENMALIFFYCYSP